MATAGAQLSETAVAGFFQADAANWQAIYGRDDDVFAVIHQLRHRIALDWVAGLALRPGTPVLEVGCGAGLASVELARLGLRVRAVDSTPAMVALTATNAAAAGVQHQVATSVASAHALSEPDGAYQLVLALGVLPWLAEPERGLDELTRTLRPGGWLIANVDNRLRLNVLADPRYTPALQPLRGLARRRHRRTQGGGEVPDTIKHSPRQYRQLLADRGLAVERAAGFGFGPFTLLGRRVLPGRTGVAAHRFLQRLAGLGWPGLETVGAQYIVLARKQ